MSRRLCFPPRRYASSAVRALTMEHGVTGMLTRGDDESIISHMVRRTTIQLDPELDRLLDREAKRRNVSRSDVIRDALRATLADEGNGNGRGKQLTGDPFFDNPLTFDGPVPPDLSENHDKYLYGEPGEA